MFPLIPMGVVGLATLSYFFTRKRGKIMGMTARRQIVFDHAIRTVKDPDKLRALASAFQDAGLTAQADLLNKRAALRTLPPDVKAGRRDAFKKGMSVTDPVKINALADAFADEGATGAAAALRQYAAGLIPGTTVTPPTADLDATPAPPDPVIAAAASLSPSPVPVITVTPSDSITSSDSPVTTVDNSSFAPEETLS